MDDVDRFFQHGRFVPVDEVSDDFGLLEGRIRSRFSPLHDQPTSSQSFFEVRSIPSAEFFDEHVDDGPSDPSLFDVALELEIVGKDDPQSVHDHVILGTYLQARLHAPAHGPSDPFLLRFASLDLVVFLFHALQSFRSETSFRPNHLSI
eukprot:scaffold241_cov340-Pavlova_lutheri.AAC.19